MKKDKMQNRVNISNQSFQEIYKAIGDKAISIGKPNYAKLAGRLIFDTNTNKKSN